MIHYTVFRHRRGGYLFGGLTRRRVFPFPCTFACNHRSGADAREHARNLVLEAASVGEYAGVRLFRCEAEGCRRLTRGYVMTGPPHSRVYGLCDVHQDRGTLELLVAEMPDVWSA
ncbi:MAG TPA: hypothetical protein VMV41_09730 [Cellulomonadaceae bacterium]|nr:hypothetical protein [Cellulomonadaceae bacterium]